MMFREFSDNFTPEDSFLLLSRTLRFCFKLTQLYLIPSIGPQSEVHTAGHSKDIVLQIYCFTADSRSSSLIRAR